MRNTSDSGSRGASDRLGPDVKAKLIKARREISDQRNTASFGRKTQSSMSVLLPAKLASRVVEHCRRKGLNATEFVNDVVENAIKKAERAFPKRDSLID